MTDQTTTAPTTPEEPKLTIAQKVEALQARKTLATQEMNAAPEGDVKNTLAQEIAVIDRKLRWYAGRSGEGKAKPATASRPSRKAAKPAPAASTPAVASAPTTGSANES